MKRGLYKSSENTSSHASVVLRGLGVRGDLHPDLRDFLVKQGLEVYRLDRNGDTLLQISPTGIAEYMREARMAISTLIHRGKDVHLFGISFGAYLTLRLASEIQNKISSIVALAPLIEPGVTIASRIEKIEPSRMRVIKLSNSQSFRILQSNISSLETIAHHHIIPPGLVVLGEDDECERVENLNHLTGNHLRKVTIPGMKHEETTGHTETRRLMQGFYKTIINQ